MKRQALENLRSAIEANTERRSLEDLKAQGKRHVRVVSGDKVMQIIKAVVADIIDREVGEMSQRDRDRIEQSTKKEFDRVLKLQAEQDGLLQDQKELATEYRGKMQKLSVTVEQADERIEQLRSEIVARDLELERVRTERDTLSTRAAEDRERMSGVEEALRKAELEVERVRGEQDSQNQTASERSQQVDDLRAQLLDRELECKRLQSELETLTRRAEEDEERLQKVQETLTARDLDLERVRGERETLSEELAKVREAARESEAVSDFRGELSAMREYLTSMEERAAAKEEATINTLLQKLEAQGSVDARTLEEHFSGTLDTALDKITRTMEAATAKPIDIVVEATDVLVDKLFDLEETEMSSNLDELDVEQKSSKSDISHNLDRLRKMRSGGGEEKNEEQAENDGAEPASESTEEADKERARMTASLDRLKAVRGSSGSDDK